MILAALDIDETLLPTFEIAKQYGLDVQITTRHLYQLFQTQQDYDQFVKQANKFRQIALGKAKEWLSDVVKELLEAYNVGAVVLVSNIRSSQEVLETIRNVLQVRILDCFSDIYECYKTIEKPFLVLDDDPVRLMQAYNLSVEHIYAVDHPWNECLLHLSDISRLSWPF
jgi:vacuolar-type H+-ATPase catalytic subunit A/Vma1